MNSAFLDKFYLFPKTCKLFLKKNIQHMNKMYAYIFINIYIHVSKEDKDRKGSI